MTTTLVKPEMFDAGVLSNGMDVVEHDYGNITTGTVTVDNQNSPLAYYTNAGAHTLAPSTTGGSQDILITNHTSTAGSVTTSGYDFVSGEMDTTGDSVFLVMSRRINSKDMLIILPLQ